jgi:hypothetical protein
VTQHVGCKPTSSHYFHTCAYVCMYAFMYACMYVCIRLNMLTGAGTYGGARWWQAAHGVGKNKKEIGGTKVCMHSIMYASD